jgi:hypothetical protein
MSMYRGTGILVTGIPHSGTRLLQEILACSSKVSVPFSMLNDVGEYDLLHWLFIDSLRHTKLHEKRVAIDEQELFYVLDSYFAECDLGREYVVIKMPFYPMLCIESFLKYFDNRLLIVNSDRDRRKVLSSFRSRGEDRKYYLNMENRVLQIKKTPPEYRDGIEKADNGEQILGKMFDYHRFKIDQIKSQNKVKVIDVVLDELLAGIVPVERIFNELGIAAFDKSSCERLLDKPRGNITATQRIKKKLNSLYRRLVLKIRYDNTIE